MRILFVDGIGGARAWRSALLRRLRDSGHEASHFSYWTPFHDFHAIQERLAAIVERLSQQGDYAIVGYSFGGVLARSVLCSARPGLAPPSHLFLLGSPIRALRSVQLFRNCILYRLLTGDCGQQAASARRMRQVGRPPVPTTCITGIVGTFGLLSFRARGGPHDGLMYVSEACPQAHADSVQVPECHALLPSHPAVAALIVDRLRGGGRSAAG